jgi:uncharacterized membrane protein AbrB (regulator of aidB expression)
MEEKMNYIVNALALILGLLYGRMMKPSNPALLLGLGLLIAYGLGNYPYYQMPYFAETFAFAILGIAVGGVGRK